MQSTTPTAKMRSGQYFDFIDQNDKVIHRKFTTHCYSMRRTQSTLFTVRLDGLGPRWCGICREGWGCVHVGPEWIGNEETWYRTHQSREVGCSTSIFPTSPRRPEGDGLDYCRYSRGRSVVLGRWLEPPVYPVENQTKSDLTTRKLCVPLVPVDSLSYI